MAFSGFHPPSEENFDEDEEGPEIPYFPLSAKESPSKTVCKYCGHLMFKGAIIVYWRGFIFVKGLKCVDCFYTIYSFKFVERMKKEVLDGEVGEYVKHSL